MTELSREQVNEVIWEVDKMALEHALAMARIEVAQTAVERDEALKQVAVVEAYVGSANLSRSAAYADGLREGFKVRKRLQALERWRLAVLDLCADREDKDADGNPVSVDTLWPYEIRALPLGEP